MDRRVALSCGALLVCACAQNPPSTPAARAPQVPVIDFLRAQGVQVRAEFAGPSGLHGWAIEREGRHGVVYSTADGQTLISGLLTDAHGGSLSAGDAELHTPPADAGTLWQDLAAAAWVQVGDNPAAPVVYVFADLNCPYCHQAWAWLDARRAQLSVRWVPVAILGGDSAARAAVLLGGVDTPARDRAARLTELMRAFRQPLPAAPEPDAVRAVQPALEANLELMARAGVSGTPALVLRNASGVRVREGLNSAGDVDLLIPTLVAAD